MSDILKCEGGSCPLKENCFRFTAKENDFKQLYFTRIPYSQETKKCEFYYE